MTLAKNWTKKIYHFSNQKVYSKITPIGLLFTESSTNTFNTL